MQHPDFVALKSFAAGENGDWWEWWIVGNLAQHEEPTLWQLGPKQFGAKTTPIQTLPQ